MPGRMGSDPRLLSKSRERLPTEGRVFDAFQRGAGQATGRKDKDLLYESADTDKLTPEF